MIKKIIFFILFVFINLSLTAQEKEQDTIVNLEKQDTIIKADDLKIQLSKREIRQIKKDSIKNAKTSDTLTAKEARLVKFLNKSSQKRVIDPLAPSKAAFYSAILPGLGQVYNKRYWKVPIVYGLLGTTIYFYTTNDKNYNIYRDAYKRRLAGFTDDEFYDRDGSGTVIGTPDVSDNSLIDAQKYHQRQRDLSLLLTIVAYALNIVDANVDAHLKQFNINDDLSFEPKPVIIQNDLNNNKSVGLSFSLKF